MISYASVERIERGFLVCELELIPTKERKLVDFLEGNQTRFVNVRIENVLHLVNVQEGDVLIVEHDETDIISVLGKSNHEKQRRIDFLSSL